MGLKDMDKMQTLNRYVSICKQWLSSNTKRNQKKRSQDLKKTTIMDINKSKLNTDPERYIARDYCLKYPTGPGGMQQMRQEDHCGFPDIWNMQDLVGKWTGLRDSHCMHIL
jgi:hypothetical protein